MITLVLDASAIKHSACLLHIWRIVAEGYRSKVNSVNIEYGSAWHTFKEEYILTGSYEKAHIKGLTYFLSTPYYYPDGNFKWLDVAHLERTFQAFKVKHGGALNKSYSTYELISHNGEPLIETTFAFKYYESENFTIILAGTIDEIVMLPIGIYGIGDDKTTTKYDYEGYLSRFAPSHQLRFYHFAVSHYGKQNPESLWGQMIAKGNIGCYINGVFLAKDKPTVFQRSKIFPYDETAQEEFKKGIDTLIVRLQGFVDSMQGGRTRPIREGFTNSACEYCSFVSSCLAPDEEIRQHKLNTDFIQRKYNPLEFRK